MLQQLATAVVFNNSAYSGVAGPPPPQPAHTMYGAEPGSSGQQQLDPIYARLRDDTRFWIQRVLVPSLAVVGSFGNIVTVIIMTRRRMRSTTNMYLAALALVDMLYLMLTFLLGFSHYPNMDEPKYYAYWRLKPFMMMLTDACSNTSVWLTVTFTIERYIAVRFPMKGKVWCTEERAKKLIMLVFAFGILFALPVPLEWKVILRDREEQQPVTIPSQHQEASGISVIATTQALPNSTVFDPAADGLKSLGAPGRPQPPYDNYSAGHELGGKHSAESPRQARLRKVLALDYTEFGKNETYKTYYYLLTAVIFYFIPLLSLILFNGFLIKSVHDSRKERILMSRMQEKSDAKTPPCATSCSAQTRTTDRLDQAEKLATSSAEGQRTGSQLVPDGSCKTTNKVNLKDVDGVSSSASNNNISINYDNGNSNANISNINNNNNYPGRTHTGEQSPSPASSFSTILSTKIDTAEAATTHRELGTSKDNFKLRPPTETCANLSSALSDERQATSASLASSGSVSLAQLGGVFQSTANQQQLASLASLTMDGLQQERPKPQIGSNDANKSPFGQHSERQDGLEPLAICDKDQPNSETPATGSPMVNCRQAGAHQANNQANHQANSSGGGGSSQERRITIMLIAVVILFLVCQVPTAAMLIYTSVHDTIPGTNEYALQLTFGNIFNFLIALNAAGNFILYSFLSRKYRRTFVLLFCKCLGKQPFRTSSNSQANSTTTTNNNNNNSNNTASYMSFGASSNYRVQFKSRSCIISSNRRQKANPTSARQLAASAAASGTTSSRTCETAVVDTPV